MSETILDREASLADLDGQELTMAVAELLEEYDWQTELPLDPGIRDPDRIATRDGDRYLLRAVPQEQGPVTTSTVTALQNAGEGADTDGLVVVAVGDVTDDVHDLAADSDRVAVVDVETAEELDDRLGAVSSSMRSRSADPAAPAEQHGASPGAVEAAVADVDSTEPAVADVADGDRRDQAGIDEIEPESAGSTTDAAVSSRVRTTETRMVLGEVLLQLVLALGVLACTLYVAVRLMALLL